MRVTGRSKFQRIKRDQTSKADYFFFLWRCFSMSFLCLCLRIFFRRFLMTLPIRINPFLGRSFVVTRSSSTRKRPKVYHRLSSWNFRLLYWHPRSRTLELVQGINQLPQPPEILAVEVEEQPGKLGDLRLIGFRPHRITC